MLKLDLWKLLLDLKSIASDILRFEPAEWIRYIAIYFNLPSEYDTRPADKPLIYLQKSFISNTDITKNRDPCPGKATGREGNFEVCIRGNHGKLEFPLTPGEF